MISSTVNTLNETVLSTPLPPIKTIASLISDGLDLAKSSMPTDVRLCDICVASGRLCVRSGTKWCNGCVSGYQIMDTEYKHVCHWSIDDVITWARYENVASDETINYIRVQGIDGEKLLYGDVYYELRRRGISYNSWLNLQHK